MVEVATRDVVLRGGDVVDASGSRAAPTCSCRAGASWPSASSSTRRTGVDVLDCGGCVVAPGLVDLHTHLRQPGREEAETVETGSRAAALGGFTAVVAMPNTEPAIDSAGVVREVQELGRLAALCDVHVAGAITVGRAGERLAPMAEMAALGVRLFTDDGNGVQDTRLMRRALEYGSRPRRHPGPALRGRRAGRGRAHARRGVVEPPRHPRSAGRGRGADGPARHRPGPPHRCPGALPAPVHPGQRGDGAPRPGPRACPSPPRPRTHHFTLTDAACASYDAAFKVNPPLRTDADVAAVKAGLADGALDAIATDHAPHAPHLKEQPFDQAPPGMLGLETALALALTELDLPIEQVLALLSWQPAAIAGIDDVHGGPVAAGRPANLCVIDPAATWVVEPAKLASRAKNTPYAGRTLQGRVRHTLLWGVPVVVDAEARR